MSAPLLCTDGLEVCLETEESRVRAIDGVSFQIGRGEIVYVSLGHCHTGRTNSQSIVDPSIHSDGTMPAEFHGVWETEVFALLLENAIAWGIEKR